MSRISKSCSRPAAHQFIYGGTSAPSTSDDGSGTYAAENTYDEKWESGCLSPSSKFVQLIINGVEDESYKQYPCFQHETLGTLFNNDPGPVTWRYYTINNYLPIWNAPMAIESDAAPAIRMAARPY